MIGAEPFPVDVEGPSVAGELPPFENRLPPLVLGADPDMVRHDVEHQAEPVLSQNVREAQEPLFPAELGIDRGMIDDVVAVHRARPRLVDGRCIHMADAEAREVRRDGGGIVEGELLLELEPVGGARRRGGKSFYALARTGCGNSRRLSGRVPCPPSRRARWRPRRWLRRRLYGMRRARLPPRLFPGGAFPRAGAVSSRALQHGAGPARQMGGSSVERRLRADPEHAFILAKVERDRALTEMGEEAQASALGTATRR